MPISRDAIDAVIKDLIDQVPTMTVRSVTLTPSVPLEGQSIIARIDVSKSRHVLCEITAGGTLQSARVIET
ncbi:hypothetical protein [Phyllobacterium zundukense]|uniref:Uncharacterized protein n=1 Tax=Phyllobacterium zundukense TaxID=1867719 RepID=A0ACD4D9W8_9HYPH|nr:hypothetical protein [Phyllobacterium zundukense]UXN62554.1 hypothetical protein N8E88_21620 [Phyllobacterium zundukense]